MVEPRPGVAATIAGKAVYVARGWVFVPPLRKITSPSEFFFSSVDPTLVFIKGHCGPNPRFTILFESPNCCIHSSVCPGVLSGRPHNSALCVGCVMCAILPAPKQHQTVIESRGPYGALRGTPRR